MKNYKSICLLFLCLSTYVFSQEKRIYCFPPIDSLVENEQYSQAIKEIEARDSISHYDFYNLAICYCENGDYPKAQNYLLKFIEVSPYIFTQVFF